MRISIIRHWTASGSRWEIWLDRILWASLPNLTAIRQEMVEMLDTNIISAHDVLAVQLKGPDNSGRTIETEFPSMFRNPVPVIRKSLGIA